VIRRRLFTSASAVSLLLCCGAVVLFMISFIKPLGVSKDWVYDFRNGSSTYRNGLYWGASGQGERFILLSKGVIYDRSSEFGNPYVDRKMLVLHQHPWHANTSARLMETTLGFSWSGGCIQLAGYSCDWQVSVPLLFVALMTGVFPAVYFLYPRRIPGCCSNCGYNLTANTSGVCPECGTPVLVHT
jgi:hypothetical protein